MAYEGTRKLLPKFDMKAVDNINQTLHIDVIVRDVETDEDIETKKLELRKINVPLDNHTHVRSVVDEYEKQREALNFKGSNIINMIIWAVTNGKSLEFMKGGIDDND